MKLWGIDPKDPCYQCYDNCDKCTKCDDGGARAQDISCKSDPRLAYFSEWNEADHPRVPAGDTNGGQFAPAGGGGGGGSSSSGSGSGSYERSPRSVSSPASKPTGSASAPHDTSTPVKDNAPPQKKSPDGGKETNETPVLRPRNEMERHMIEKSLAAKEREGWKKQHEKEWKDYLEKRNQAEKNWKAELAQKDAAIARKKADMHTGTQKERAEKQLEVKRLMDQRDKEVQQYLDMKQQRKKKEQNSYEFRWGYMGEGRELLDGPLYGNWTGGDWSGGQVSREPGSEGDVPPINDLDASARIHDFAYGKAGSDPMATWEADNELVRRVRLLPEDPREWNWFEPGHPTEQDIIEARIARDRLLNYFRDWKGVTGSDKSLYDQQPRH